ncbi:hypothetical protein [Aureimonas phyllosphaerae]|uniref:Uncharacterized protein n=1 Tax=Aureimonas phyllosphaerae TaxID=1166078 RepID=A0A7W6BV35_9HYPH|nr:hypothetical protein [Aureimonas phyllosphaerae]MBB3934286.1 hypothetical protein [Aureimonas phyllosphaerae]MBB3958498.1 hypothetical protein [Aureimonas phyllosphaerae]SFE97992.1 hypothetical protein SAMN05216566_101474 [Aureimonas phyllosphaerae]
MHDIKITGLNRMLNPKANAVGQMVLAEFNCIANGLRLRGCALVKTDKGGLTAWAPKIDVNHARRSVQFADDNLRHAIMMHARDAYRALGGTDVDCIGASKPIGAYSEREAV